jgi:hypothetical protein
LERHREMQVHLIRYFFGERRGALVLLALGGIAVFSALLLLAFGGAGPAWGLAVPLGAIGLVELAIGGGVFARADRRMAALSRQLESAVDSYRDAEHARMNRVLGGLRWFKAAEIAVLAGGGALAVVFRGRPALFAAGAGCILQALLLLVVDTKAEERAREYSAALRRLLPI